MKTNHGTNNAPTTAIPPADVDAAAKSDPDWRPVAAAQIRLLQLWAQHAVEQLLKSGEEPTLGKTPHQGA